MRFYLNGLPGSIRGSTRKVLITKFFRHEQPACSMLSGHSLHSLQLDYWLSRRMLAAEPIFLIRLCDIPMFKPGSIWKCLQHQWFLQRECSESIGQSFRHMHAELLSTWGQRTRWLQLYQHLHYHLPLWWYMGHLMQQCQCKRKCRHWWNWSKFSSHNKPIEDVHTV